MSAPQPRPAALEVAALALAARFGEPCDAYLDAEAALDALHAAGWRIVRMTDFNEATGTIADEWLPEPAPEVSP
jgi:hypothetical protein